MTSTRRQLLAGASSAAAALALPRPARAGAEQDRAMLAVLVAYSSELVFGYDLTVRSGPAAADARRAAERFQAQATQMDDALRQALVGRGGSPPARHRVTRSSPRALPRAVYLRAVANGEERLIGAWYLAVQRFGDRHLVAGAAAYMAAGGRRLVVLRKLLDLPLVPQAFETGVAP